MSCLDLPLILIALPIASVAIYGWAGVSWLTSYLIAINIIGLLVTGWDKIISGPSESGLLEWMRLRVPNRVLFWWLSGLGGSLGVLLGIYAFGHKTSDKYAGQRAGVTTILLMQVALLIWLYTWGSGECRSSKGRSP